MLCVGGRSRTTANPHVTTSDLEKIIEEWLVDKGHRDLNSLFKELGMKVTWKTAPLASVLAMYATLFRLFAMVCPNGVIPGQRLNMALMSVHKSRSINYSKMPDKDFIDWVSGLIRCTFSKYRDLFRNEECKRRCLSKATYRNTATTKTIQPASPSSNFHER